MHRSTLRASRPQIVPRAERKWLSTSRPEPAQKPKLGGQAAARNRFDRLIDRSPRFLRPTLTSLKKAPLSNITAFFILHEITAIVPLFGLASAFHYFRWLPPWFAEGVWVSEGVEKFGRYARRKGWISEKDEQHVEQETNQGHVNLLENGQTSGWFNRDEDTTRWIVEFATAYAVVKALLPIRIVVSVWASPWFARWVVIPVSTRVRAAVRSSSP
ncbi:hypothetical protein LTR84_010892 [Exophiala bonariae]|uniref:DUF1279 domain-containing protein n=1 Tax=Exophiala bonariae TaxID=1690606 RepID=A0AAV9NHW1_9EURO|nr:hypothetical protein LTR84_010892 [Exophiala bonariae]